MKQGPVRYICVLLISLLAYSCSTVKVVPEGEFRLKKNSIEVLNTGRIKESDLLSYVRQKPNSEFLLGWNPFLSIYNWSNGTGNGWDRFVTKLGQAPVIFDSTLVKKSNENIANHLQSLGYYGTTVTDTVTTRGKLAYVNYTVTPGKRYPISDIRYSVNDPAIKDYIINDTASSLIKRGRFLSEKLLEEESVRVTALLRDKGFYNFSKNFFFFEADTLKDPSKASLVVKVENYTRNEKPEDARAHRR